MLVNEPNDDVDFVLRPTVLPKAVVGLLSWLDVPNVGAGLLLPWLTVPKDVVDFVGWLGVPKAVVGFVSLLTLVVIFEDREVLWPNALDKPVDEGASSFFGVLSFLNTPNPLLPPS